MSKTGLICPSFTRLFRTNRGAKFGNNLGTTPVHTTKARRFYTPPLVVLGRAATLATAWEKGHRARYRPGYIAWPVTSPHVTGRETRPAWLTQTAYWSRLENHWFSRPARKSQQSEPSKGSLSATESKKTITLPAESRRVSVLGVSTGGSAPSES